jgi:hypothetical protein
MHGGPINLKSAILPDASLRFASLLDADLQAADLTRANLVHARLNRANLKNAILKDAVLDHADFADANLGKAVVTGANFTHARNLTQNQIDEAIGDASTTLPGHLARPAAWVETATPLSQSSGISHQKALIACIAASVMAGAILLGVNQEYWEPASTKPDRIEKPVALASPDGPAHSATTPNADPAGSKPDQEIFDSLSKGATAPLPSQAATENPVVRLMPPGGSPAIAPSAPSTANPTIDSSIRIYGVLGLSGPPPAATARVEIEPVPDALPPPAARDQPANMAVVEPAPPLPDRNPIVASVTAKSTMSLTSNAKPAAVPDTTIVESNPPLPERNPIVASTTEGSGAETGQSANARRALVRPPTQPKVTIPDQLKPGQKRAKGPEVAQQPIQLRPKSSTADVLAGGL